MLLGVAIIRHISWMTCKIHEPLEKKSNNQKRNSSIESDGKYLRNHFKTQSIESYWVIGLGVTDNESIDRRDGNNSLIWPWWGINDASLSLVPIPPIPTKPFDVTDYIERRSTKDTQK